MMNPLPRLAIALDGTSVEPLEPILDQLHGLPVLVKVGLSLYTAVGPSIVHHMRMAGFEVFLDLKFHDIPHQVGLAVAAAARLDVALLTVHAAGGRAMLEAAAESGRGKTRVVAVSVLTSLSPQDLPQIGIDGDLEATVAKRLRLTQDCGLAGAVMSPHELHLTRDFAPSFVRVVPGIRATAGGDDQARTATAGAAAAAGATVLVVGRPVLSAADPRAAAEKLLAEIAASGVSHVQSR
jgi:orotidine-5'-phosphate decarboxylase